VPRCDGALVTASLAGVAVLLWAVTRRR